ncbi:XshC-Cox1-family protein [Candidatus Sulfopaludibacter sp. SbA3]|nr:XshC-Cox1-family protein [Candidatus Sulfopaludibacter sp. SbA3]
MHLSAVKLAARLASEREPFAIATVIRVEGSSSAKSGSSAIIDSRGKLLDGWVGGGCAESAVRGAAIECIAAGAPRILTLDMMDELMGIGMPCGGIMDVYIEPVLPQPDLVILGHGRIAEVLARLGTLMNFHVTVSDPGAERAKFPEVDRLVTDDYDLSSVPVGPGTYVVIATQHRGDQLWLRRVLSTGAAYIALVSSHHRANLVIDDLAADGMDPELLERVWAPAGLDIGAATPEEIALSVMSQIVAIRRGSAGQALKPAVVRACVP